MNFLLAGKLYASSSFYSPNLHPTVEDQVELARRISDSLSDISNQQSKGQSMYVNRKKRSVKWVHEHGDEDELDDGVEDNGLDDAHTFVNDSTSVTSNTMQTVGGTVTEQRSMSSINSSSNSYTETTKKPLKLVMNPRGQVQDLSSLRKQGYEPPILSPEACIDLVNALNAPQGKGISEIRTPLLTLNIINITNLGAELFAKRRKKSEKWVVEETSNTQKQQQYGVPASPSAMMAFSEVGTQRVQHNMKLDQIQVNLFFYSKNSLP